MKKIWRLVSCVLAFSTGTSWAQEKAEVAKYAKVSEIPVEVFFRRAQYSDMALSPDGTKLAAVTPRNGRSNLVVIDIAGGKVIPITNFTTSDVSSFEWVSNDRLFLQSADLAEATGSILLTGRRAIDIDGSAPRDLLYPLETHTERQARRNTTVIGAVPRIPHFHIISRTFDGSGDSIVEIHGRSNSSLDLYRFNTKSGERTLLTADSPGNVIRWVIDRDLVPRIAIRLDDRKDPTSTRTQTMLYRESATAAWQEIGVVSGAENQGTISPIAFDYDNKTLYVSSNVGRDKRAIYKYDIAARKLGELLVEHPLIDLSGNLIFSRHKRALFGVLYNAEMPGVAWFDDGMAQLQASMDKALPNRVNAISIADDASRYLLVYSASATDPGTFFLYDTEKKNLQSVASTRRWLPPEVMGARSFLKYKTRDGMEIPAWLTVPNGSEGKNLPLVVHIHGGPAVRAYSGVQWGRSPIAQFLASRGYAVLEPEPRGSTGFGRKHYVSSFKQWGLTMQDDITDGALHLVKEGIVDKNRMCLFGGSYGGYATLQGLVKDPDLWRCGSAYVAVTDLELLQTVSWSDTARLSDYFETDFKRRVGDSVVDRDQFNKTSPAKNAEKIKAPVMLTMGSDDQRVPLIHGTTMRDALERAGKSVDYKVYAEAHGFNKDENVIDFYTRLEKFFATHLR